MNDEHPRRPGHRRVARARAARWRPSCCGEGWHVVADGRDGARLARAVARDAAARGRHRGAPATSRARSTGRAWPPRCARPAASTCWSTTPARWGRARCRAWPTCPLWELDRVLAVNVVAPLALVQLLAGAAGGGRGRRDQRLVGRRRRGLRGLGRVRRVQGGARPAQRGRRGRAPAACASTRFDPGDMATDMHQRAFPGEDISDRPSPESVVPALLRLVRGDLPSGRYRAADLGAPVPA